MARSFKIDCFQLKADFLPITTMRLMHYEPDLLRSQLETTVLRAPHYFSNAPMIVDFNALEGKTFTQADIKQICSLMRQYEMLPVASRGLPNQSILPNLSEPAQQAAPKAKPVEKEVKSSTKIITKPVRAGTQVYAKNTDLVILSSVNAGAEVMADGNIHIYGPLRGRALAGANGDTNAKIFCHALEAELVAIAGHYLLNDNIKSQSLGNGMVHIFLDNGNLQIQVI